MAEKSCSGKRKSHNHDLAGSSNTDRPHSQKSKSGIVFKLIIGVGLLAIICAVAMPNPNDQLKDEIQKIAEASSDFISGRELASLLNNQNQDMISQTQISEKGIEGKIVEWELEVMVVASLPDHYKILTKPTSTHPGTLLTLFPQNSAQIKYIANVQPGAEIKIKGKISGIRQGRVKINPAILM